VLHRKRGEGEHQLKTTIKKWTLMLIASTLLGLVFVLLGAVTAFAFLLPPTQQEQQELLKSRVTYQYPNWLGRGRTILASSILSFSSTTKSSIEDLKSLLAQHPDAPNHSALLARLQTLEAQLDKLAQLYSDVQKQKSALEEAQQNYTSATEAEVKANTALQVASQNKKAQQDSLTLKQLIRQEASAQVVAADEQYSLTLQTYTTSQSSLAQQVAVYELAVTELHEAQVLADLKESNYNTLLQSYNNPNTYIPDPNWTPPTIENLLFNPDFAEGTEGWSGVSPGWQGSSPALINGEVIFSYSNQTVSQGLYSGPFNNAVLTLSADWFNNETNRGFTDVYSMTVQARDINQSLVGTATYNSTGSHGWQNKSVTLTPTGPVSYITVSFTGIDSGFWYGVYGPHFKNPVLHITHGQGTAPRIPDPAIYAQAQEAQSQLTEAQNNLDTQNQNFPTIVQEKERLEQAFQVATTNLTSAEATLSTKQEALASAELEEQTQASQYNQAELYYVTSFSEYQSAQDDTATMEQQLTLQTNYYETAQQEAETFSTQVDSDYQSLSTEISSIQPAPVPEEEPLIDLEAVPVLGEALAALSDVGEALANIGSDMSPEVRETAEKIVLSAIVVTQVATQAAQIATQAAAASASAAASSSSSGSSSTGRRK
jgi:hypothetical protein